MAAFRDKRIYSYSTQSKASRRIMATSAGNIPRLIHTVIA